MNGHRWASADEWMAAHRQAVRERLAPHFRAAGIDYPPAAAVIVALKREGRLELYAGASRERLKFIRDYQVLAASGLVGPKLKEGDFQVPEGIYRVSALNPNSRFHVSVKVDYPNAFDRLMAARDGREQLGGDIFIHGGASSVGCLAVGDLHAEELFALAADAGPENVRVIVSPWDLRRSETRVLPSRVPEWTPLLYARIRHALQGLERP